MAPRCVACGEETRPAFEHDGYQFHRCLRSGCHHVFVHPVPSDAQILELYDATASHIANSNSWTVADDYERDPEVIRRQIRQGRVSSLWRDAQGSEDRTTAILDIGCSTGMFLRVLKDSGYVHLMGMDLSPSAAAFVRDTHGIPCVDALDDVPDASFDIITCFAILEHVPDPAAVVRALRPKLKPGGRLVALSPNYDSVYRRVAGRSWVWLIPPVHLQYFSPASLSQALRNGGLVVERMRTTYANTYLYLLMHHLTRALKRDMPSTSRTRGRGVMAVIRAIEVVLRVALAPGRVLAYWFDRGAEVVVVARRSDSPQSVAVSSKA